MYENHAACCICIHILHMHTYIYINFAVIVILNLNSTRRGGGGRREGARLYALCGGSFLHSLYLQLVALLDELSTCPVLVLIVVKPFHGNTQIMSHEMHQKEKRTEERTRADMPPPPPPPHARLHAFIEKQIHRRFIYKEHTSLHAQGMTASPKNNPPPSAAVDHVLSSSPRTTARSRSHRLH